MSTVSGNRTRPVIVVLAGYYLPGYRYGGPIRSLSNLIEALGDEFDFRVITRNHDEKESVPYDEALAGLPVQFGKAEVRYLRSSFLTPWKIREHVAILSPDLIYFNSFFDGLFTVFPLWLRRFGLLGRCPVLIAPRGEFSPGALSVKALKKRIYLAICRGVGLFANLHWQATGEGEGIDIARVAGDRVAGIAIAPNLGSAVAAEDEAVPRASATFAVAFLSRISPMKNLLAAIRIVRALPVPVRFDIYGPAADESYWGQCQEAMKDCPSHVNIKYHGAIANEKVSGMLQAHDALLLPTLGENFGHVIVEALRTGIPVVISDRTPWKGLKEAGAGYDLPLSDELAFTKALGELALRTPEQVAEMRRTVLAYAKRIHLDGDAITRSRLMLRSAIDDR